MYMVFRGGELHLGLLFCVVSLKRGVPSFCKSRAFSLYLLFWEVDCVCVET